ncbi:MAG: oligosaccharide flippase family protein [Microcoleus sp. CAN_BIN18]|nr:oligosaccharide flippase family protein [Microcoleus sp. CAN_BIN18]
MSSVKQLAVRGAVWTIASYGLSQVLRLGSNLILTRLLVPEMFGLMSLVYVFITALHLFSDVGIGTSLIQNKRGEEPDFINTAWTLQVYRGLILWFCTLLLAWPVAQLYQQPQFLWLIPVVGLGTVISGFNSTSVFTLNRNMALGKLAIFELSGQVLGIAVMIVWAWFSPTIWAILMGSFASQLMELVWSHYWNSAAPHRLMWNQEVVREILSFGKWIFVSTALTFFAEQADRLILGKILTLDMLGIYGVALTLADLPRSVTLALSSKVMFPAISKLTDQPREILRAKVLKNRQPILIVCAIGLALLVSFGDIAIKILYDRRYVEATWMLPILALGIWPRVLCNTGNESVLFAIGKIQYPAFGQFLRFIWTSIGLWVAFSIAGLPGAIVAVALNDLGFYAAISYGLWREKVNCLVQDLQATLLLLGLLAAVMGARYFLGFGLPIDLLLQKYS